ncbi:hypothetical protein [Haloterrigena alkaliphila]|uniref:hypothetical protein n=1 Tax=Haloterrigena alkaliphila TaxID=2816475 RepID=UPI001CEDE487|nr:hypothetical protein [Haloterrigena alkaliphila]UHQ95031.1 hypothetical protein J0X25_18750 [Haloterrigena alkaliphila]
MSEETTTTFTPPPNEDGSSLRIGVAGLTLSGIPFFVGGVLVIEAETPPSGAPLLGMLSHALWALAIVILTVGVVALLRAIPALRRGLAGYLGSGVLGLGVLHGLQWVTWAYVDVRGARETDRSELLLDAIIVPFGAGHLLMYAILMGAGIALFGWAIRQTEFVSRYVAGTGVGLGVITILTALYPLLLGLGGGSEGHVLFDIATLLIPVLYVWTMVVGVLVYRRS